MSAAVDSRVYTTGRQSIMRQINETFLPGVNLCFCNIVQLILGSIFPDCSLQKQIISEEDPGFLFLQHLFCEFADGKDFVFLPPLSHDLESYG